MATEKQIMANRRNALMSTGARSLSGKNRSSQNALRHGLTARQTMISGEDPEEFAGLRQAMFSSLEPQGALENQLIERAASLIWRMRRVQAFEVALFQWVAHYQSQRYDDPIEVENVAQRNDPEASAPNVDFRDGLVVGRTVEALLSSDLTSKLSRYEAAMQNQLSKTLKELREQQRPRLEARKEVDRKKANSKQSQNDPEHDPAYWAAKDRERMLRMDPP